MIVQITLLGISLGANGAFVLLFNNLVMLDKYVIFRVAFMSKRPPTDVAPMLGLLAINTHMCLENVFPVKFYVATWTLPFDFVMLLESQNIVISKYSLVIFLVWDISGSNCLKLRQIRDCFQLTI